MVFRELLYGDLLKNKPLGRLDQFITEVSTVCKVLVNLSNRFREM